jgi:hypothetical protein
MKASEAFDQRQPLPDLALYALKPYPEDRKATIRKRRIGYEVQLSGLFIPERDGLRWRLTHRSARRCARDWIYDLDTARY